MVGLWKGAESADQVEALKEGAKADMFASTLREATRMCIELARQKPETLLNGLNVLPGREDRELDPVNTAILRKSNL
jgi:hypothetical protein